MNKAPTVLPKEPTYALPGYAVRVIEALEAAGYEAWAVGGWVRDALRGAPAHDVDVTTSAPWQESVGVLREAGICVHETGTKHGTITAVVSGRPVEVTTYRVEGSYSDHRHPDAVRFVSDVREDLARRDFTINAMAYHPERGLLDPFGGRQDIGRGVVRAVGDPARRFEEDALRVLRAVRFACRLGYTVEPATQQALVAAAPELAEVSNERVGQELSGIVASGHLGWALAYESEVMHAALPELPSDQGLEQQVLESEWAQTAARCCAIEEFCAGCAPDELRWAALLADVGKQGHLASDRDGVAGRSNRGSTVSAVQSYESGPSRSCAKAVRKVMDRLALPRTFSGRVSALLSLADGYQPDASNLGALGLLAEAEGLCSGSASSLVFEALDLARAEILASAHASGSDKTLLSEEVQVHVRLLALDKLSVEVRRVLASGAIWRVADLAVSGADLIRESGQAPGPWVGESLRNLLSAVMTGKVPNERKALLEQVRESRS